MTKPWPTRTLSAALTLAALTLPASTWAINKCTQPDGRVVYQDAACPSTSKTATQIKTQDNTTTSRGGSWRFERNKDPLTNHVACMAISPLTTPKAGTATGFLPVHAVVIASKTGEHLGIRTSENKDLFHNDISSTGVKPDNGAFTPFTLRPNSHVMGFENSTDVIGMLEKSNNMIVRVRMWPYDQLFDMDPIPSSGLISALTQVRQCAKVDE